MAETARKLEDDSLNEPDSRPKLGVIEGGGETTEPIRGHLKSVYDPEDNDKPSLAEQEKGIAVGNGQESAVSGDEANLQNNAGNNSSWKNSVGAVAGKNRGLRSNKGKFILGTLFVTIAMSVGGIVFLLPGLAVKSVMAKSTEFFMDRVSYVTEKRVERLIGGYFARMITGPNGSIERCGTFISADCFAVDPGEGMSANLYRNWSQARLEERLNTRYGLEFTKNTQSGLIEVWKTNAAGIRGQVGIYGDNTVTREIVKLVESETRWTQIRDRLGLRSLLAGRYGANKWCFIKCDQQDSLDQVRINALTKAKLRIAARIMTPVNAKQTAIILCLISDCSDAETSQNMREAAREALGATDAEIDEAYQAVTTEITDDNGDVIRRRSSNSITQHYTSKLVEKVLTRFGVQNATRVAFTGVPIAGQIYAGVTLADLYDSLDSKIENRGISRYLREINESAGVDYFSIMQASSDEVFNGGASLADTGAMATILSGSNKSRVYQRASGEQELSTVECEDGVVLSGPSDPLACPEKSVQPTLTIEEWRQNDVVQAIEPFVNTYGSCLTFTVNGACALGARPRNVIKPVLRGIDWLLGGAASLALGAISYVPEVGEFIEDVQGFVADKMSQFIGYIATRAFNNRFIDPEAEGQVAFDQLAAGIDISANSFAMGNTTEDGEVIGLGGTRLTEEEEIVLAEEINEWKKQQRSEESVYARYFDVNNHNSLVASSAIALNNELPESNLSTLGSIFSLDSVVGILKNIFPSEKSYANGISNREDVFNVHQYAYAVDDPNFEISSDELTIERCAEFERIRQESVMVDPETRIEYYTASNPCLMDEILIESLTKKDNLDPDSARYGGGGTGSSTTTLGAAGLNGYAIPCEGIPREVVRAYSGASWEGVPDSGVIGTNSAGQEIKVYIREACDTTNPRTVVIGSSIHGSENGGQVISQELLFNTPLPPDVRVVAIPEINKSGVPTSTRKNANGVDLNRNFDYEWGTLTAIENLSTSGVNYRGTAAESEPETQAVASFLRSIGATNLFISYHDNINWVAPVGSTPFEIAQSYSNSTGMNIGNNRGQYVTQRGSMDAWFNEETDSPTLLVELNSNLSNEYINTHVEAVRRLFVDNVVQ